MGWSPSLNEYEKMVIHMNNPRVEIDNVVCPTATLVKVDSVRKHGIHLEAIQVLADLNLNIRKAYISSDGRWCMDVFHVTDLNGNKLAEDKVINYLEESFNVEPSFDRDEVKCFDSSTCLELIGTDRLGLLSEISAVISDLHCEIVNSVVWTHVGRMVALVFVKNADFRKIHLITARLKNVLNRDHDEKGAKVHVAEKGVVNVDRRLHKMMFEDCDYDVESKEDYSDSCLKPRKEDVSVTIQNWIERGYSVVTVQCKDRPKLLFDVVFTLSDMKYAIPHGNVDTRDDRAHLEFYVRHLDGTMITLETERDQLIKCLRAAVKRRSDEGLKMELSTMDERGLLAKVTRTFREYGLSIARAEISTNDSMANNTFYLTDASGFVVASKTAEDVIEKIGSNKIKIAEEKLQKVTKKPARERSIVGLHYLGNVVKSSLNLLGLIRSCS